MSRLDDYRAALSATHPEVSEKNLDAVLADRSEPFVQFVIDHGLGPLWHARTGREAFHASRMQAEALFVAQEQALRDATAALDAAGILHVVIKGAATRLVLYDDPAVRACFDIDILVRPGDRLGAAEALVASGFAAMPDARSISRELVLTRDGVDIDLHWGLLREGRLRFDPTEAFLEGRMKTQGVWMANAEDTLFTLLVHPAFAKHLAGWDMGLHRVADLLAWLRKESVDWPAVREMLRANGVCTAAWATLRWAQLLAGVGAPQPLPGMLADLQPGRLRKRWIDTWLRHDLPARTSKTRWLRLTGFSVFLHDTLADALRAARGRRRARRRSDADLAAFRDQDL